MSTKTTMTEQVAAQIDRQWPYSRLNVTSTGCRPLDTPSWPSARSSPGSSD